MIRNVNNKHKDVPNRTLHHKIRKLEEEIKVLKADNTMYEWNILESQNKNEAFAEEIDRYKYKVSYEEEKKAAKIPRNRFVQ